MSMSHVPTHLGHLPQHLDPGFVLFTCANGGTAQQEAGSIPGAGAGVGHNAPLLEPLTGSKGDLQAGREGGQGEGEVSGEGVEGDLQAGRGGTGGPRGEGVEGDLPYGSIIMRDVGGGSTEEGWEGGGGREGS